MNCVLKEIKDLRGTCVSIIFNTHRTHPDNQKDVIVLKNLIKQATEELQSNYDKRLVARILENLNTIADQIDHRMNSDSMAVFANEDIARYVRLPISVNERCVVDDAFVTRDLIRSMHQVTAHYTLVLGSDRARLIEAANGRLVEELGRPFPMINSTLLVANQTQGSNATRVGNFQKEFFRRVDDAVWAVWSENPLPIVITANEKNFAYFQKVSQHNDVVIGVHNDSHSKEAHHIVEDNYYVVREYNKQKNAARIEELKIALNTGNVLSDFNDIWGAIQVGRGETLFIKNGYYQPAKVVDGKIVLLEENMTSEDHIDDIIDELIDLTIQFGGDCVFIDDDCLDKFGGIALTTRY